MNYLIANWKAEITYESATDWLAEFEKFLSQDPNVQSALHAKLLAIVIAPPMPYLQMVKNALETFDISIAAQSVSNEAHGKFTGEVTAEAVKHFVSHSIVGHSERRIHFGESNDDVAQKVLRCTENSIAPIVCIRDARDIIPENTSMVAYEPTEAIGSGKNENPEDVARMKNTLQLEPNTVFIYGGSVDETNIKEYTATEQINGFLVGTASLHAEQFYKLAVALL